MPTKPRQSKDITRPQLVAMIARLRGELTSLVLAPLPEDTIINRLDDIEGAEIALEQTVFDLSAEDAAADGFFDKSWETIPPALPRPLTPSRHMDQRRERLRERMAFIAARGKPRDRAEASALRVALEQAHPRHRRSLAPPHEPRLRRLPHAAGQHERRDMLHGLHAHLRAEPRPPAVHRRDRRDRRRGGGDVAVSVVNRGQCLTHPGPTRRSPWARCFDLSARRLGRPSTRSSRSKVCASIADCRWIEIMSEQRLSACSRRRTSSTTLRGIHGYGYGVSRFQVAVARPSRPTTCYGCSIPY